MDNDGSVQFAMEKFSGWSEPVNVGPGVNSPFQERSPALSPDKLSLYFTSDRPGGFGGSDIYVSRRDCFECPFGPAVNLGPNINTAGNDGTTQVSKDGKLLLYSRPMPDGFEDIVVSEREDEDDDFGWGPPKGLCSELNDQAAHFNTPWLMKKPEKSGLNFYYSSRPTFAVPGRIFRATVNENDGQCLGQLRHLRQRGAGHGAEPGRHLDHQQWVRHHPQGRQRECSSGPAGLTLRAWPTPESGRRPARGTTVRGRRRWPWDRLSIAP